jgi:hypothetical protein
MFLMIGIMVSMPNGFPGVLAPLWLQRLRVCE